MADSSYQWVEATSVTGQPLHVYGRKLVGLKAGDVDFFLHFYVTDIDYPLVSVVDFLFRVTQLNCLNFICA